jgi:hypothetical protein
MTEIATVVYAFAILGLFALGRDRDVRTSLALWLPVVWLWINGSRPVSLWLQIGPRVDSADRGVDGSPLDACIFGILLVIGLAVLAQRKQQAGNFLRANGPLLLFFAYCALSTLWSDYTIVAFKRWTKATGDVVMVLVILTDSDPTWAIKRFVSRVGFLLIPLSILLIKYYPDMARYYSRWEGKMYVSGVSEDKNMLGMICLIFGLGAWWRFLEACRDERGSKRTRQLIAQGSVVAMVIWLFWMANSMTSMSCFMMTGLLLAMASFVRQPRVPAVLHFVVVAIICVSASALFLNVGGGALETMGRDPTLTGRTEIWRELLSVVSNPLIGTGFESFWLGDHLRKIWAMGGLLEGINEAHNGYLEVYLNLGWIGVALLAVLVVTGYRNVVASFRQNIETAKLRLAFFVAAVVYCLTEAAFKMMCPIWVAFLLAITAIPDSTMPEGLPQFDNWEGNISADCQSKIDLGLHVGLRQEWV